MFKLNKKKILKQTEQYIKGIEAAKRNGTINKKVADGLLKQLKDSKKIAIEEMKRDEKAKAK